MAPVRFLPGDTDDIIMQEFNVAENEFKPGGRVRLRVLGVHVVRSQGHDRQY
jgi:hypothetical protein